MLIEEVNVIGPQPLQASLSGSLDVLRAAIRSRSALTGLGIDVEAELRSNHNLFAYRLKCLADQLFICEWSISLGSIEESHSLIASGADQLDHLAFVGGRAVGRGHAHAAESQGRHFKPALS